MGLSLLAGVYGVFSNFLDISPLPNTWLLVNQGAMLQVYCGPVLAGRCVRCHPLLGLSGPSAAPKHVAGLHHLAWTSPGAGWKSDNRFLTGTAKL